MQGRTESHSRRSSGAATAVMVMLAAVLLGIVVGIGSALVRGTGWESIGLVLLGLFAVVAGLGLGLWWWRRVDEAAREAHKWAWWWGGCGGLATGAMGAAVTFRGAALDTALAGYSPTAAFAMGVFALLTLQFVGYTLAWAGWWLSKR